MDKVLCLILLTFILKINVYGEGLPHLRFASILNSINKAVCNLSTKSLNLDVSEIRVTFHNNGAKVTDRIGSIPHLISSTFDLDYSREVKIYLPGFMSNLEDENSLRIKHAFTNIPSVYFIAIDYSAYTSYELNKDTLEKALLYFYDIGVGMGLFVSELYKMGFKAEKIHAFGHSSGGQLIGIMGEIFYKETGHKIARLTGIDPARHCFTENTETQLKSGQADYVEVIHCDSGNFGSDNKIADVDFFFNPKENMYPGCYESISFKNLGTVGLNACAHIMCVKDWIRTVYDSTLFRAYESFGDASEDKCTNSETVVAGYHGNNTVRGVYYTFTN